MCNIKKRDWGYAPLHAPCNKDKKHGQTDGNNGHIWHARCAGQCNTEAS